ncbi:MAG TPA: hypothetical protein VGK02_09380 [Candidatus Aquicultor sp.]|jgi:hypothetical protein
MVRAKTKSHFFSDIRGQVTAIIVLAISFFLFAGISIQFFAERGTPCTACHATRQETATWKTSPHRNISCLSCHQDPGYLALVQLELKTTQNFTSWLFNAYQDPIVAQVKDQNCLKCHDREIQDTIISKGIRMSHKEVAIYKCTSCHASVAHEMSNRVRNYPDMDSCASCHNFNQGDVACEKCHPQKTQAEELYNKGPWKVTHGPDWQTAHGMGDPKTCQTCHDTKFCMSCHKSEVPHTEPWSYLHGQAAKVNVDGCYQCHRKSLCTDCHRLDMPHPANFLQKHEFVVKDHGYELCWRCHNQQDCVTCHFSAAHPNTPGSRFAPKDFKGYGGIGSSGL